MSIDQSPVAPPKPLTTIMNDSPAIASMTTLDKSPPALSSSHASSVAASHSSKTASSVSNDEPSVVICQLPVAGAVHQTTLSTAPGPPHDSVKSSSVAVVEPPAAATPVADPIWDSKHVWSCGGWMLSTNGPVAPPKPDTAMTYTVPCTAPIVSADWDVEPPSSSQKSSVPAPHSECTESAVS